MRDSTLMILLALLATGAAVADSITFQGQTLSNVYVREGGSMYYVQVPADGRVIAVAKSDVPAGGVVRSTDAAERARLLEQWKASNANSRRPAPASASAPAVDPVPVGAATPTVSHPAGASGAVAPKKAAAAGDESGPGVVSRLKLRNVPLGQALKVALRDQNLDYSVEEGYIRVSTPERLRREPMQAPETRYYELRNVGAETLPKIVLRNPAGATASGGRVGYGGGQYGGGQYSGGGYGGGYGGGQYGGGRYGGGYGGGQYGGGYGGGGYGGGGYGGGGYGGGGYGGGGYGGGGYGGGQHFSNISQLFSTIDDRMVGETPAVIGMGGLSAGPLRPQTR